MTKSLIRQSVLVLSVSAVLLLAGCGDRTEAAVTPAVTQPPVPTVFVDTSYGIDKVIISEYMNKNRASFRDEDGDFSDWIELVNTSDEAVELGGWHISDKENKSGWEFPDVCLGAGERIIIFASGKDKSVDELHADFSLSADESVYLRNQYDTLLDTAPALDCGSDCSAAAAEDGTFSVCLYPTPGEENSREGYVRLQYEQAPSGPLVISEAVVFTSTRFRDTADATMLNDWVEIKNISDGPVDLSRYFISDDKDDYCSCRLPEVTLQPGDMTVVLCNDGGPAPDWCYCADFSLSSETEHLYLADGNGELVDWAVLRDIPYGCSFGRIDGENGWFYFAVPTPNRENLDGKRTVAEKPQCSIAGGVYNDVKSVSVSFTGEGDIHYTTDGSLPTADSPKYISELQISSTCVLRAVSITEDALPARAVTVPLIINEGHVLPVISVVSDNISSFNSMYLEAVKEWEIPGSVSFFDDNGSFSMDCGMKMSGQTSLELDNKSMYLSFRGIYGSPMLNYDIFGGGVTEFTDLQVRAGQNQTAAVFTSELCQDLALDVSDKLINQRSRYCVLYINGAYVGIYALKEKTNEQLYASLADVSRDSVSFLKAPIYSETDLYRDVFRFAEENDLSLPENYAALSRTLDMDSLIDWLILEGYCANADLQSGNVAYCISTENGGQWKLVMYDMDATFHTPQSIYFNILDLDHIEPGQTSMLIYYLLKNSDFRESVLRRASELYGGPLNDEALISRIDEYADLLRPEIARHFDKLERDSASWDNAVNELKNIILDSSWHDVCIDKLCQYLRVSGDERELYFGNN